MYLQDRLPQRSGDIPFDNLQEIFATRLTPSGYPGRNTEKYLVHNYPHLVIRNTTDANSFFTLEESAQIFNELPEHGINSLPFIPYRQGSDEYAITYKVDGESLDDVLDRQVDEEMVGQIDATWANLVRYLQRCKQHNQPYAQDIYTSNQFMVGTINGELQPQLWMVDLESVGTFIEHSVYYGYEGELFDVANEILRLQDKLKKSLYESQLALHSALGTIDPLLADEAWECFRSGVKIDKSNEPVPPILLI